jgi:hypothetical protein
MNINPPHFHAIYGEKEGLFDIRTAEMLQGNLPGTAQSLVKTWASQYQNELMQMWDTKKLQKLDPLQ